MLSDERFTRIADRLSCVHARCAPPAQLQAAHERGRHQIETDPTGLVNAALEQARANPALGAALALGAFEILSTDDNNSPRCACAQAAAGIATYYWGYYAEAENLLTEAVRGPTDNLTGLLCDWHIACCAQRLHGSGEVTAELSRVAAALDAAGDPLDARRCDLSRAAFIWRNDAEEAARLRKAALDALSDPADIANVWLQEAFILIQQGTTEERQERVSQLIALCEEADLPALLGYAYDLQGQCDYLAKRLDEAIGSLSTAADHLRAIRHAYYYVLTLTDLATVRYVQGDMPKARQNATRIRKLATMLQIQHVVANSHMTLANIAFRDGKYGRAARGYRAARQLYEQVDHPMNAAICTANLGLVALRQTNFARSLHLLQSARTQLARGRRFDPLAQVHHNLGRVYATFGYFEPANRHFERAIRLAKQTGGHRVAVRASIYRARILARHKKEPEAARHLLNEAARRAWDADLPMDEALCGMVLGEVLLEEGATEAALTQYQEALERFEELEITELVWECRLGIAACHLAPGKTGEAARALEAISPDSLPPELLWQYRTLAARIARAEGELVDAMDAYQQALRGGQTARRSLEQEMEAGRFALALQPIYEEAFQIAVEQDNPGPALTITELHGAQLLSTRQGRHASPAEDPETLPARLTHRLNESFGEEWTVCRYAWPEQAEQEHLRVFVLTPAGLDWYPVHLNPQARRALDVCTRYDMSYRRFAYLGWLPEQASAYQLSRSYRRRLLDALLPQAARDRLHPDHTLIIVPSRELHALAFQALLDGDEVLINRTRLLYGASLEWLYGQLAEGPAHPLINGEGLVLAQTTFAHPGYEPLPHTEEEATIIAGAGADRPFPLDRDAVQRAAEAGEYAHYDWLHIATHSRFDRATGTYTGLLIGEGLISLDSIRRWKLSARLVTLSACQAGLGQWNYGDEVTGLAQAFLRAGAQAVIAGLWLTYDRRTAAFMADLYGYLREGTRPTAALAAAQRKAAAQGVEPYYWASFSLTGQP